MRLVLLSIGLAVAIAASSGKMSVVVDAINVVKTLPDLCGQAQQVVENGGRR